MLDHFTGSFQLPPPHARRATRLSAHADRFLPGVQSDVVPDYSRPQASSGAEGADAAMGAMRTAQTGGYGVLPSPELPNTFLAQAYDLDDPWGPSAGPCFTNWTCCDPKTGLGPVPYPDSPPTPSSPSSPIQCAAPGNWLNSTVFVGGFAVAFGGPGPVNTSATTGTVPATSSEMCCSICSNATLAKLGCAYWNYYQDRSGPAGGKCYMTTTLGTYKAGAKGYFSKWGTAGGIRAFGPTPPTPPPKCDPATFAKCAPACAAAADTPVAMGGIHPRSKKPVGDRLGTAAFNTVYVRQL